MTKTLQHQIIGRALELIADPAHWSTGAWARTSAGHACGWNNPAAARFCASGALQRAAFELAQFSTPSLLAVDAEKYILEANSARSFDLPSINDMDGHASTVEMFKKALASASIACSNGRQRLTS